MNRLCLRLIFAICIYQSNPSGEQLLHHALLDLLVLGQFLFQQLNFAVHIRKDLSDCFLFGELWNNYIEFSQILFRDFQKSRANGFFQHIELQNMHHIV